MHNLSNFKFGILLDKKDSELWFAFSIIYSFLQTPMYYHGAAGALLVYDISRPETFERVKSWVEELKNNVNDEDIGIF